MHKAILKCFVILLFITLLSLNGYGSDTSQETKNLESELNIHRLLMQLQENHEEIKNFKSQVEQAQAQYRQSKGLYYPTLDLMADGGRQNIDQEFSNDTNENRYNVILRARQLITDFGKTKGIVDR
jgi:outer membrane protein TolC